MIGQEIWDRPRTIEREMPHFPPQPGVPMPPEMIDPTGRAPIDYSAITRDLS